MINRPSEEELIELYINQGLSQRDIAEYYNVGQTTIRRWMNFYNIESRDIKESKETLAYKDKVKNLGKYYKEKYTKEHILICQYCKKEFSVYGSEHKNQKYCSEECLHNAITKPTIIQYCEKCGKEIENINGRNYKRKYCQECAKEHLWIKPDRLSTECAYCGKEIFVIKSRYEKNNNCFCDVECMANYYSIHNTGENSPTWKGGKPDHYTGRFDKQRDLARERDEYTCQLCGITEEEYGKQMSVHHIKLYRDFEDKIKANQLENLICLCEPCHRYIHSNANVDKIYLNNDNDNDDEDIV